MYRTEFQTNEILANTRPTSKYDSKYLSNTVYTLTSEDTFFRFLVDVMEGSLSDHMERARKYNEEHIGEDKIYAPCVIELKRKKYGRYQARLLAPPGISEDCGLLFSNMVVPELRIWRPIGKESDPTGFIVASDYLNRRQEFYASSDRMLKEIFGYSNARFQGVLLRPEPNDGRGKKRLRVRPTTTSIRDLELMDNNREILREMRRSGRKFWWEL